MTTKNPAAVALGRLGGQSRSAAKVAASRKNGLKGAKKGGRPRKETSVDFIDIPAWDTFRTASAIRAVMQALGSVRSEKKAASSRKNGKKGGRPRKKRA